MVSDSPVIFRTGFRYAYMNYEIDKKSLQKGFCPIVNI